MSEARQLLHDTFYQRHGPCCAGCDWWRSLNSRVGECVKSAPGSGNGRAAMLGIEGCSLKLGAGHALTPHDHLCGEFKDNFDWSSLAPSYLRTIGWRPALPASNSIGGSELNSSPTTEGGGA